MTPNLLAQQSRPVRTKIKEFDICIICFIETYVGHTNLGGVIVQL